MLAEFDYHLRHQRAAMHRALQDLEAGAYRSEPPTTADLTRARELDQTFRKLELGLTDAPIVALAERLAVHRLLTIDP